MFNDSESSSSPTRSNRAKLEASNHDSIREKNKDHNSEDVNSGNQGDVQCYDAHDNNGIAQCYHGRCNDYDYSTQLLFILF